MARTTSRSTSPPDPQSPRNRTPQPLPRRGRTVGDFVKAFLAFVALAVLLVGVPAALVLFVGWPLPGGAPSLSWLQREITVGTFINVLTVVVWFAWAQFTACVLVEIKAALSGVGIPSRVPGAGGSQMLARQLVAALLLVGATAASFAPGLSQFGQSLEGNQKPGSAASAQQTPGLFGQGQQSAASAADALAAQAEQAAAHAEGGGSAKDGDTKYYRIQPPEGRHHDSLWEIAERHLGDGRRYKEIYQLNKDREQPDGSRLSEASLIRPGWIMEMPADAHGGELVEMPHEAPKVSEDVKEQISDYSKTGDQRQGGGQEQGGGSSVDRDTAHIVLPEQRPSAPGKPAMPQAPATPDTPAAEAPEAPEGPAATDGGQSEGSGFGLPEALLGAPLLAAGLLGALGRRRRHALWQSAMGAVGGRRGMQPRTPTGDAADAHDALLVGADPEGVRLLDLSLRGLAASLAAENRELPTVYAAWLTNGDLHLQLAQPAGRPPAPWQLGQDQTFWVLARTDAERYEDVDTAAPYPGLVSLGTLGAPEESRLLLNLESVPGIVSLSGSESDRAAVFASVAAELATNGWSDRMTITVVGFGQDLTPLAPNRLRHLEDVEALLETMEAETRQRRGALGAAGHDSVLTGRTGPARHTRWAPHLVLLAAEPTGEDAVKLAELAADAGRLGIGYLVGTESGNLPGAAWEMEITGAGKLLAPLLGLELQAQTLPEAQQRAVVRLFTEADPESGSGPTGPDDGPTGAAPPFLVDVTEQGRPAVYARLVGTYEIIGLDTPDGERSALMHEALALLLLHREGVHPRVLASALWPRGVTDDVRDALVERLREWLGTDPDGSPRLRADQRGRLTLAKSVVSDLDVLRSLYHEATQGRGAGNRAVRGRMLTDALVLVRGPLLADRPQGRYAWLTHEIIDAQLPLLVADIGLALCEFHLEKGRAQKAIEALNAALGSAPGDERLWNELLRATAATDDSARLQQVAADLLARSGARGLPPRTEALLDELLPAWRSGVSAAG
ncbi:bacterial transcriptional activator domain-containing protein [Streptomyces sp. 135]|uniref:bacterial transcriptional activator domain-containing protein n=1 Tax=Streptomyces sp. 135 TaxID=2838850 RepID=UPI001CBBF04B|nr:bacterial transcriptional activator domain-containing protein [Streptomyces sp. 135]